MADLGTPTMTIRAGHPDFLDLRWERSIVDWDTPRLLELPKGISRHEVRFVGYPDGIYAIKELPVRAAEKEWVNLAHLEELEAPAVAPVGLVVRSAVDASEETSAAIITQYLEHSFSYRELLSGPGFGARRNQMLDAFAGLLVELHISGLFWGDCSLSNVLYRFDAEGIRATLVDSETSEFHSRGLTDGQRQFDLEIMETNVAGGMADIAAETGRSVDAADLALGADISRRYRGLWDELHRYEVIKNHETWRITERINALNKLGFEVGDVLITPDGGDNLIRFSYTVGRRTFHTNRLRELTGIEATENQARQILSDLHRYVTAEGISPTGKAVKAAQWRIGVFEPTLERISSLPPHARDPVQAYCDFLHHRYVMSSGSGTDVPDAIALADWIERGQPGYELA
jgi:hypothetical protein